MKLLALLIGLVVERLATQLFHLRRLRWLDRAIDAGFRQCERFSNWPAIIPVTLLAFVLVLPVLLLRFGLGGDTWFGFPYLVLAIVMLFFSLGPKDVGEDIDEYCRAIEEGDVSRITETSRSLAETDIPDDAGERIRLVEAGVWVQANNRLFAVIFWFVLLGPVGAWAYRVTDLLRRRAAFNVLRNELPDNSPIIGASEMLQGIVVWVPARLTAIGYAMAGSFDGALSAWRSGSPDTAGLYRQSEQLLARVGTGALALNDIDGESDIERGVRGAVAANGLVYRLFLIWVVVIAAMTLYGWSV